ncbi:MAG: T9SS type A sorting domain-containing protein [Ignavibacteriaceae bacterium]|nr:T9SS type A sorting domain-containing protein [Ignavibacteriaceae bacterium]
MTFVSNLSLRALPLMVVFVLYLSIPALGQWTSSPSLLKDTTAMVLDLKVNSSGETFFAYNDQQTSQIGVMKLNQSGEKTWGYDGTLIPTGGWLISSVIVAPISDGGAAIVAQLSNPSAGGTNIQACKISPSGSASPIFTVHTGNVNLHAAAMNGLDELILVTTHNSSYTQITRFNITTGVAIFTNQIWGQRPVSQKNSMVFYEGSHFFLNTESFIGSNSSSEISKYSMNIMSMGSVTINNLGVERRNLGLIESNDYGTIALYSSNQGTNSAYYASKLDSDLQLTLDNVFLFDHNNYSPYYYNPYFCTDGSGGLYLLAHGVSTNTGNVRAMDNLGNTYFTPATGSLNAPLGINSPAISYAGNGEAMVIWIDLRSLTDYDVYFQKIGKGTFGFTTGGIPISISTLNEFFPPIAAYAGNNSVVAAYNAFDQTVFTTKIMAALIQNDGTIGPGITGPAIPNLNSPADGAVNQPVATILDWDAVSGAVSYQVQIATDAGFSAILKDTVTSADSYDFFNGLYNTTYYWRVSASDGSASSGYQAAPFSFTTTVQPPVVTPPAVSAYGGGSSVQPSFTWPVVSGADQYVIQISTNPTFTPLVVSDTVTTNSYSYSGLLNNGTTYYYQIISMNSNGAGAPSTGSFTTVPYVTVYLSWPINNPTVYTFTPQLNWYPHNAHSNLKYDVEVSVDSTFPSVSTLLIAEVTATNCTTSALLPGTQYFWRVKASYIDSTVIGYSDFDSFTTYGSAVTPVLSYPVNGTLISSLTPTLYWYVNSGSGLFTYELEYRESGASSWTSVTGLTTSSYTLPALAAGTDYEWRTRSNNGTSTSAWSVTETFSTQGSVTMSAPNLSYPVNSTVVYNPYATLYWWVMGNSSGLTYDLEINTTNTFTGTPTYTGISGWNTLVSGLSSGTYYWKVRGTNGVQTSDWSATGEFVVSTQIVTGAPMPVPSYPNNGAVIYGSSVYLNWYTGTWTTGISFDVEYVADDSTTTPTGTFTSVTNTSQEITGLLAGKTYFWRVKSKVGANSAWSPFTSFQTAGSTGSLIPVATWPVGGVTTASTDVDINWYTNGASVAPLTFELEYNTDNSFTGTATVSALSGNSTTLTNLTAGVTYYYKLRTYNGNAYSAWSDAYSFVTPAVNGPAAPVAGNPVNNVLLPTSAPVLSWFVPNQNAGYSYDVEYSLTPSFENAQRLEGISQSQIALNSLQSGYVYYWRVRSKDGQGVNSPYSNAGSFVIDGTTDIKSSSAEIPTEFSLMQNYPNPFNPSTRIKYSVPSVKGSNDRVYINLSVYDVLGNVVAVLVDGDKAPGVYESEFDASGIPSGIYIYKITGGDFRASRKMLLIK